MEERVRLAKGPGFDAYAYAQVRSVAGLADDDFVRESLGKITAPTIVIYGAEDKLIPNPFMHAGFPSSVFEAGARAIPGARTAKLEGCGHSVQLDCPREYGAAMERFLAALPRPADGGSTTGQ